MKVTPHFSLAEFACRDGTPYPAHWIDDRLRTLCRVLEVIRGRVDRRPVRILSGYRTEEYNRRIGGARASQHVQGRAADIQVEGMSPAKVHAAILALYEDGTLRGLLGGLGEYPTFSHVDVRPESTGLGARLARWSGSRRSNVV